ncbi:MAG: ATP-binding protein [Chloroflexota bacterium]
MKGHWHGQDWGKWKGRHNGRFLFLSLLAIFGIMALLLLAALAIAGFLFSTRFDHGRPPLGAVIWLAGCGLMFTLPLIAAYVGRRAFRGIAAPLAELMAASNAIAQGDLTVRVSEQTQGQFNQLARSFNHMTEELARMEQQRRNLTADVAHELRTPLHIIQGNLEGIMDGVYDPTPDHLDATLDETRRLARLIDDLQTLSQVEMGRLPLHLEPVSVAELLQDAATSFSGQAEAQGIELGVALPEEKVVVMGDNGRLLQILSNLLVNALRHTHGGGQILLKAEANGDSVQLVVCDNGEGIASEDLPFIFDRFWRGDRARTHTNGDGGGLGLAIVKQLVLAHHGTITATSQPHHATTFTITLPRS